MSNIERLLKKVEKPARYIGNEINSIDKNLENIEVRFAFAFPDLYEIGMSYMGLQILYNILNKEEGVYCERVFAPAKDMEEYMRKESLPLFSLETKTDIKEFDILGFTLQYEMSFTNILNILNVLSKSNTETFENTITKIINTPLKTLITSPAAFTASKVRH